MLNVRSKLNNCSRVNEGSLVTATSKTLLCCIHFNNIKNINRHNTGGKDKKCYIANYLIVFLECIIEVTEKPSEVIMSVKLALDERSLQRSIASNTNQ